MAEQSNLNKARRVAVALAALAAGLPVLLRSIGLFPDNDSPYIFPIIGNRQEGILSVLPIVGAIYFYGRHKIDKNRHQEIMQQLDAKRDAIASS